MDRDDWSKPVEANNADLCREAEKGRGWCRSFLARMERAGVLVVSNPGNYHTPREVTMLHPGKDKVIHNPDRNSDRKRDYYDDDNRRVSGEDDSQPGPLEDSPLEQSKLVETETKKRESECAKDAERLPPVSTRVLTALERAGITTTAALEAMTADEVRSRPGIGGKAIVELVAAGVQFRAAPAKPAKVKTSPESREATDIWLDEWQKVRGHKYPWDTPYNKEIARSLAWVNAARKVSGDRWRETLRKAIALYIAEADAGRAFPDEPPTTQGFMVKLAVWMDRALHNRQPGGVDPLTLRMDV